MKKLAIIGAGELGSRHLQSLANLREAANIQLVDPCEQALNTAKNRFEAVKSDAGQNVSIEFFQDIKELNDDINLCIIATNANVRLMVLENLLAAKKVKYIVFEKVLFQSEEQYGIAQRLLDEHQVKAWVNCPRRMFPIYTKLDKMLQNEMVNSIQVKGYNWGLACNSIHFLDLFAHFLKTTEYKINTQQLEDQVLGSKRKGFVELFGTLSGSFANGTTVELTCLESGKKPSLIIDIDTSKYLISVLETSQKIHILDKSDNTLTERAIDFPYQSNLTEKVATDLFLRDNCNITTFRDSAAIHLPFISALKQHISRVKNHHIDLCPIT